MSSSLTTQAPHTNASFGTQARMSPTRALAWKQFADLAQAFILLTAGSLVLFLLCAWAARNDNDFGNVAMTISGVFSCGFALVTCFVSFVTESEHRTREFLRSLPVSSFQVGGVKLLVGTLAVVAFFALQIGLAFAAVWLNSILGDGDSLDRGFEFISGVWIGIAVFTTLVFVSCLISCSYWSSSWMSVFSAFFLIWSLAASCIFIGLFSAWRLGGDFADIRYKFVLVGMLLSVMALAIGLPLVWLRRKPLLWRWNSSNLSVDHHEDDFFWASMPGKLGIKTPALLAMPGRDRFTALCWQSVRQQAMMPVLSVLSLGLMVWLFTLVFQMQVSLRYNTEVLEPMQVGLSFVLTMAGYGFGVTTLYRDKLNSNLSFFQQHREHGRELLLARVLFPLLLLFTTAALGHGVITWFTGFASNFWLPVLAGLSAFSVMLMWAMAFRSHVYALGVGLVLALTMNGFISMWLTEARFYHSWMAVLPFVWLLTCFAYAPTWLSGRRSAAWMTWFTFVSVATFAAPLWQITRWMLGLEPV